MKVIPCLFLLAGVPGALALPALPEAPFVLYGTAADGSTNQPVTIASVVWQATDGTENGTFTLASSPPTRIVEQAGQSFYVLEVPFETRVIRTAAGQTVALTPQGQSLELKSPSPTYILTPFINGRAAMIRSVNGVAAAGSTVSLAHTPPTNGKVWRVDLSLPSLVAYETWVGDHFPTPSSPEAARTADPDGDGKTNYDEYLAGTDPRDSRSTMMIKTVSHSEGGGHAISWDSIVGRTYTVERSFDMKAWAPVLSAVTGTGQSVTVTDPESSGTGAVFYRVKVMLEP